MDLLTSSANKTSLVDGFNSTDMVRSAPISSTPNSSDSAETATPAIRLIGATILAVFIGAALVTDVLLLVVYAVGFQRFKKTAHTFFTIAMNIVVADLVALVAQVLLVAPETFLGCRLYPEWLVYAIGAFDTNGFAASAWLALLLAFSQLCIFMAPKLDKKLFANGRVTIFIAIIWTLTIAQMLANNLLGCYKNFDTNGLFLYYISSCYGIAKNGPWTSVEAINVVIDFFFEEASAIYNYVPLVMMCIHALIYAKIRLAASSHSQSAATYKMRIRFLMQSFIICFVLFAEDLAFELVPQLPAQGQWAYIATFFTGYLVVLTCCIHALVIFAFNSMARAVLVKCTNAVRCTVAKTPATSTAVVAPAHEAMKANGRQEGTAVIAHRSPMVENNWMPRAE